MKKYDNAESKTKKAFLIVIGILLLIFVLLLCGVFYIKNKVKLTDNFKEISSSSLEENISKQLDDQKGESTISISITEEDLFSVLNANSEGFPLKNPSVKITSDKIILSGKTSDSPLSFKLDIGMVPHVENNKVVFDIKEIKTAGVSAPKVVTDKVNKSLSDYLNQVNLNDDIKITDVKLYQGYLIATGERK
ncbi:MAG: hypothetical protein WC536_00845 [Patescibacteria group bacterium]